MQLASLQSLGGLLVILIACFVASENRKAVKLRLIIPGLLLQLLLAICLLKIPAMQHLFSIVNSLVHELQQATEAGTSFMFGYLGGAPLPYTESVV